VIDDTKVWQQKLALSAKRTDVSNFVAKRKTLHWCWSMFTKEHQSVSMCTKTLRCEWFEKRIEFFL